MGHGPHGPPAGESGLDYTTLRYQFQLSMIAMSPEMSVNQKVPFFEYVADVRIYQK